MLQVISLSTSTISKQVSVSPAAMSTEVTSRITLGAKPGMSAAEFHVQSRAGPAGNGGATGLPESVPGVPSVIGRKVTPESVENSKIAPIMLPLGAK